MKESEHPLLRRLRSGDEEAFTAIYLRHREAFISWLVSQNCPAEQAADLYQLTILTFYDNVVTGKLTELNSSLKTYLFSIGRNKWQEIRRGQSRMQQLFDHYFYDHIYPEEQEERVSYEATLDLIADCLEELGDPCKSLLELFYYEKVSMEEISRKLGYKNADTAKNQKYKCLRRLRRIFRKKLA